MENKKTKYRVRDLLTGMYQDTGFDKWSYEPKWSEKGKSWSSLDELKTHFRALEEHRITLSSLWEIVEIEKVGRKETEVSKYPASVLTSKKK